MWNPWHGCRKVSEGCQNCYMFYFDKLRGKNGADVFCVKSSFDYPVQKNRDGSYKIKSGSSIRVCLTSDFFLKEADAWRDAAWSFMRERSDVAFFLITKRPERVLHCLPNDWNDGWENVVLCVTCENQKRSDERIPILLQLPFKHKEIVCAPLISEIYITDYLKSGQIQKVSAGGEDYEGARPCDYQWVQCLRSQCEEFDVTFHFRETGCKFIKDGRLYNIPNKTLQREMATKSNMNYSGKPIKILLKDPLGFEV